MQNGRNMQWAFLKEKICGTVGAHPSTTQSAVLQELIISAEIFGAY